MTYANPTRRQELITGLRVLADFLASHPGVPAPPSADVLVLPPFASDSAKRREIGVITSTSARVPRPFPLPPLRASTTGPVVMILAIVALVIGLGVLALLVLVLAGIRDEERHMSLTSAPRTRIGATTRRLTGVGVRTPDAGPGTDQDPDSPEGI